MNKIMVISPHPDDETLGCGGSILRHAAHGDQVHWLNITGLCEDYRYSKEIINKRELQIEEAKIKYRFKSFYNLNFPSTRLDEIPLTDIIDKIRQVFQKIEPEVLYLPFRYDIHTDHKIVFDAVVSCTKWFRYPYIRRVLTYETLSETDSQLNPKNCGFQPNVYVDITNYLEEKLEILDIYDNETNNFPFPRSEYAVRALAAIRGAASGFTAAEAFMLLRERI